LYQAPGREFIDNDRQKLPGSMPEYLRAEERNREMADIPGLTVETVSRIMAERRRQGISNAPRGRIVVSARAGGRATASLEPISKMVSM
jgi:hypothetical protein